MDGIFACLVNREVVIVDLVDQEWLEDRYDSTARADSQTYSWFRLSDDDIDISAEVRGENSEDGASSPFCSYMFEILMLFSDRAGRFRDRGEQHKHRKREVPSLSL